MKNLSGSQKLLVQNNHFWYHDARFFERGSANFNKAVALVSIAFEIEFRSYFLRWEENYIIMMLDGEKS